ncbi:hypothetical protein TSAR_014695 [Trichomalopsis sarcophagae]|uniref:Reverse transcriptase RNase H-like domain-containing protein n=1 Tax=Trichomalopsis sarcophagae TaxID=543379 RepID=A0A232EQT8_9HYME|nr:hypothetical protein TSAR_014695 [Trichomalopsis sarcophagae]
MKLEEYYYNIKYKKGCGNYVADSLSRIKINNQEEDDDSLLMVPQASDITASRIEKVDEDPCDDLETARTAKEDLYYNKIRKE